MFKNYLICMHKQYCEAKGLDFTKTINIHSNEFVDWIVKNRLLLNKYIDYLDAIGMNYSSDEILEIGKGRFDSLVKYGVSMVSMSADTIGKTNSSLFIDRGNPLILRDDRIIIPTEQVLLTHNPYFRSDMRDWYLIHNKGYKNISIGMFGNIDDENRKIKILLLEQLSKQMTEDYTFDYDTGGGMYFCSLNSKRRVRERILTRTR